MPERCTDNTLGKSLLEPDFIKHLCHFADNLAGIIAGSLVGGITLILILTMSVLYYKKQKRLGSNVTHCSH